MNRQLKLPVHYSVFFSLRLAIFRLHYSTGSSKLWLIEFSPQLASISIIIIGAAEAAGSALSALRGQHWRPEICRM